MSVRPFFLGSMLVAGTAVTAAEPAFRLCEPWQTLYQAEDATGGHVLGLWQFQPGAETQDSSGRGHTLQLQGALVRPDARFGGCLESFAGWPKEDVRHAAIVPHSPHLSPQGAFTLELWICPKQELEDYPESFLVDKKYVAHTDYQLVLSAADRSGLRRLTASLGFGEESERFTSEPAEYRAGTWYHIAFTYDGAGEGRFYRDGVPLGGSSHPGRAAISPGKHPLSIGDRIGSLYHGFPGYIAQVRLCAGVLEFRPAAFFRKSGRTTFVRMEPSPAVAFELRNLQRTPLKGATARISLEGWSEQVLSLPEIASGEAWSVTYKVDTRLRPGEYRLKARLEIPGEKPYASEEFFSITLVGRPLPYRMPVVMWGVYGAESVVREMERLKRLGFTHCLGLGANYGKIWEAGRATEADTPEAVEQVWRMLDVALANDFGILANLSPGRWLRDKEEFQRVDRTGKPYSRADVCGQFERVQQFCRDVGASVAQTYGPHPAFQGALIHTEVRGESQLCFHPHDREAYRKATGLEIPEEVVRKEGVQYADLKDFPANRVIPDDHPIYRYLQWFWKEGDGWNAMHTAVHQGLKSTGRKDLWTFHDPAVRVASVWGSGGEVDVLSQWTYSYPDPIRIGLATDELFAMAAGAAHRQQVMKMTQIIWYRSQTAPQRPQPAGPEAPRSVWEDTDPEAAFITIAPMHLREAFWCKIARPIQGIMYHGWQSLVPTDSPSSYRYTHPQTQHELARLVREVVQPLGPTLVQVPDRKSDVALLESFASQMFARRGTYGWNHTWIGDAYHVLLYAHLQPEVIYDETVITRGLEGYRVLVMPDCDVLTESVVRKVQAFQKAGGIVIGDERLCPAIRPDILLPVYERTKKADADRRALQERAAALRQALDRRYRRYADSTNPDVIVRCRRYRTADYLFAVNDRREYGTYVGHHGLVMENGLPSDAVLSLARREGHVYDLLAARPVPAEVKEGQLRLKVHLGPCEGRLYLVTERPIAAVRVEAPESATLGSEILIRVAVTDDRGRPLDAVVPLQVEIFDPDGRPAEFSGFYGARDGQQEIRVQLAPNDVPGLWQVRAKELASGRTVEAYVRVKVAG